MPPSQPTDRGQHERAAYRRSPRSRPPQQNYGDSPRWRVAEAEPLQPRPDYFIDRESSWLAFNGRVLDEAYNPDHPLLERLSFLSISAGNLDEFYMVRVAGLKGQVHAGVVTRNPDGMTPAQQRPRSTSGPRAGRHPDAALARAAGLLRAPVSSCSTSAELSEDEIGGLDGASCRSSPGADAARGRSGHPFPFIPNRGFGLVLELRPRRPTRLCLAPLPASSSASSAARRRAALRPAGAADRPFLDLLFPGFGSDRSATSGSCATARSRSRKRRRISSGISRPAEAAAARLGDPLTSTPPCPRTCAASWSTIWTRSETFSCSTAFWASRHQAFIAEERPDLIFPLFNPRFPERISDFGGDCFAAIRDKDFIVHHPFESFDVVVQFLRQAADPRWWRSSRRSTGRARTARSWRP